MAWLEARTRAFREAIRYVAIDPAAPYAHAVTSLREDGTRLLPNATVVVDHFHLVKLANDALSKVRRRVTWQQQGRRGRKVDPAWANRRRLLCARERLSEKAFAAMWNALIDADPSAQILTEWIAKEELRALLALARTGAHRDQLRHRLDVFYRWCAAADIDELHTLAATVETWWPAIEAFLSTGTTNARTEGVNRLVKQVKRLGLRLPKYSQQPSQDPVPLHPHPAGSDSDFNSSARSKLKSRHREALCWPRSLRSACLHRIEVGGLPTVQVADQRWGRAEVRPWRKPPPISVATNRMQAITNSQNRPWTTKPIRPAMTQRRMSSRNRASMMPPP